MIGDIVNFLRERFSTNLKLQQIFLLALLGLSLSLTINSIFVFTGLIKFEIVPSKIDDKIIYIIAMVIRIITSCIIGPIVEEIVFRGFLFNSLSRRINIVLSAIITTLIFAFMHISISSCIFALITGFIFIYFYIKTNNLLVSFIIHSFCNMMALIVLFIPINLFYIVVYIIFSIIIFLLCDKYIK